ncbi:MCE family protein [Actinomadura sp. DC4]|uniref:MCE family protein n=1 Tax=Actinomadura sp. DC4 TaxID=3055069 RepID=UPI0025B0AC17|nr:MCE family protein [Actinomadura sp. DC4]MDN3351310.1 MCE family protein [Actinomadura sp. DC4]
MRPRILINLAFFALLGAVLAVWAASTLIRIDAIDRPFHVTADFTSSPGLHEDLQVTYLGVAVGRVGTVRLETGRVAVRLDLDHGVRVPSNVGAQVLRKSVIGEPYVDLSLPKGTPAAPLREGGRIPLSRTSTTIDYGRVFDDLGRSLDAVDPQDAHTVVHELAEGLDGRGESIRDIIGDTDQLTATLAANSGLLDDLSVRLTRLTHTLALHRGQIASSADDLAAFTASLRSSRQDFDTMLTKGPTFLHQVDSLLETSRPGLDCLLTAAAVPGPPVFTSAATERIHHLLTVIPTLQALVNDITVTTSGVTYFKARPVITLAGPTAAEEYDDPTAKPVTPEVPRCAKSRGTGSVAVSAPAEPAAPGSSATPSSTPSGDSVPELGARPVSSREPATARLLPLLPIILSAVVLLAVAANTVRVVARTRSGRSRPHD